MLFGQGRQFILSSCRNVSSSPKIVEELQSYSRTQVLDIETLEFVLDVIAECHETALPAALNLLVDEFALSSNQDSFIRAILLKRTFTMFNQLLGRLVGDDDQPDMEVFENAITAELVNRLTKMKEKYASNGL